MEWINIISQYSSWGAYTLIVIGMGVVIRYQYKDNTRIRAEAREDREKTNLILEKLKDFLIEIKTNQKP